jgi:hypothetical protein
VHATETSTRVFVRQQVQENSVIVRHHHISGAISKKVELLLLLIEACATFNQDYYIEPCFGESPGVNFFCFLQNQTYSEVVRREFAWLFDTDWRALSPDFNPLDYFALEIHVGQTRLLKLKWCIWLWISYLNTAHEI